MANRTTLVVIFIGSLLALPDLSWSRWVSSRPHGITTFWINSALNKIDEKNSEKHQTEVENIGWRCKFVLWRIYCGVLSIPKVTTSTHAISKTTVASATMAVKKTARNPYNRNRGILG